LTNFKRRGAKLISLKSIATMCDIFGESSPAFGVEHVENESFEKFYFDQIRRLRGSSPELSPDVNLLCEGGQTVAAHKFVLYFASQFFQVFLE
jgi:hypothetical protein